MATFSICEIQEKELTMKDIMLKTYTQNSHTYNFKWTLSFNQHLFYHEHLHFKPFKNNETNIKEMICTSRKAPSHALTRALPKCS